MVVSEARKAAPVMSREKERLVGLMSIPGHRRQSSLGSQPSESGRVRPQVQVLRSRPGESYGDYVHSLPCRLLRRRTFVKVGGHRPTQRSCRKCSSLDRCRGPVGRIQHEEQEKELVVLLGVGWRAID